MTVKVTLMELLVILNQMLQSKEEKCDYPNIHEDDLPYRSRSWVLRLVKYLEKYWGTCTYDRVNSSCIGACSISTVVSFFYLVTVMVRWTSRAYLYSCN
jgi:hypothetical protein